jgi:HEAT repeats
MEILNFNAITHVFKILAAIQITLFIVLLLVTFLIKLHQEWVVTQEQKISLRIHLLLTQYDKLDMRQINFLKKYRTRVFDALFLTEKDSTKLEHYHYEKIVSNLFLPFLKQDAFESIWTQRNRAAKVLQLKNKYFKSLSPQEEKILIKLLNDDVPLVAVNAAEAIFFAPTQQMLDQFIDVFSNYRRSQYDLLGGILKQAAFSLIPMILHRLSQEKNANIRVFCYRMLRELPKLEVSVPFISKDLDSENIDLNLASLSYVTYLKKNNYKEHLIKALNSPFWEVRARAAKLIGYTKDEDLVKFLEPFLKDKVWWVRFRAAEALSHLGHLGLSALKAQKLNIDQFAFEISKQQIELFQLRKTII